MTIIRYSLTRKNGKSKDSSGFNYSENIGEEIPFYVDPSKDFAHLKDILKIKCIEESDFSEYKIFIIESHNWSKYSVKKEIQIEDILGPRTEEKIKVIKDARKATLEQLIQIAENYHQMISLKENSFRLNNNTVELSEELHEHLKKNILWRSVSEVLLQYGTEPSFKIINERNCDSLSVKTIDRRAKQISIKEYFRNSLQDMLIALESDGSIKNDTDYAFFSTSWENVFGSPFNT